MIVKICRDNADQDLTLVSMVKTPLPSKRGRKDRTFLGEFVVVNGATRIGCQQNLGSFAFWLLMTDTSDFLLDWSPFNSLSRRTNLIFCVVQREKN